MAITDNLTRFKQLQGQIQRPTSTLLADNDTTSSSIAGLDAQRQQMMSAISRAYNAKLAEEEQAQQTSESQYDPTGKTVEQMYAENGRQSDLDMAKKAGFDFKQPTYTQSGQITESGQTQGAVLPSGVRITQTFGQKSKYDVFSKGVNYGVDFAIKSGTPVALPPGKWEVVDAYSKADQKGYIGNKTNSGYGNSVLVRNPETGETMRFSHLSGVNVQPGKVYTGGTVLGAVGTSGNTSGSHLDLEYRDMQGKLADVLKSKYSKYLIGG